ncbi:hypothetical protein ACLB2K_041300 [Fragaria x ananassa]
MRRDGGLEFGSRMGRNNIVQNGWRKLWGFQLPNKMKVFMWRACNNFLPCNVELKRRKIKVQEVDDLSEVGTILDEANDLISHFDFCSWGFIPSAFGGEESPLFSLSYLLVAPSA